MFEEMDEKANIEIYLNPFDEAISEDMQKSLENVWTINVKKRRFTIYITF